MFLFYLLIVALLGLEAWSLRLDLGGLAAAFNFRLCKNFSQLLT
jgi:hypothetical protein